MSKQFKVEYHACGNCFTYRTLPLISTKDNCYKTTTYPFWKEPADVINRVSTRQQLQQRSFVMEYYITEYYDLLKRRMVKYHNENCCS